MIIIVRHGERTKVNEYSPHNYVIAESQFELCIHFVFVFVSVVSVVNRYFPIKISQRGALTAFGRRQMLSTGHKIRNYLQNYHRRFYNNIKITTDESLISTGVAYFPPLFFVLEFCTQ